MKPYKELVIVKGRETNYIICMAIASSKAKMKIE